MQTGAPEILSAGQFDSRSKFPQQERSPERIVQNYELELFTQTELRSELNDHTFLRQPGILVFARPGDRRRSELPLTCLYIHFATSDAPLSQELAALPSIIHTGQPEETQALFDQIICGHASDLRMEQLAAATALFRLLLLLRETAGIHTTSAEPATGQAVFRRAMQFIHHMYTLPTAVEDIAAHCSVSVSRLHKIFAEESRTTPHAALLERRIAEAKKLLLSGKYTITEIAAMCGFNSPTYFSDAFRRSTGLSPTEFCRQAAHKP